MKTPPETPSTYGVEAGGTERYGIGLAEGSWRRCQEAGSSGQAGPVVATSRSHGALPWGCFCAAARVLEESMLRNRRVSWGWTLF